MSPDTEEEKRLIEKARQGDFASFDKLVSRYEDRIYHLAIKMLSEEQDAHEVVQETFLNAWRNIRKFRGDASFYTWVNRIAVNACYQKLRGRKKDERSISLEDVHPFPEGKPRGAVIEGWSFNPVKAAINEELRSEMRQAIMKLPEKYRIVFYYKDIEGLKNEQIAEILDLSVPAVKSRLNRARLFLRKELAGYMSGVDSA